MRSRRASYQLAFSEDRILDIALQSGYESHEAFSRAFRRVYQLSPSMYRRSGAWRMISKAM